MTVRMCVCKRICVRIYTHIHTATDCTTNGVIRTPVSVDRAHLPPFSFPRRVREQRTSRRARSPHSQSTTGLFTTAARREGWAGLRVARAALREAEERRRAEEEEEGEEWEGLAYYRMCAMSG